MGEAKDPIGKIQKQKGEESKNNGGVFTCPRSTHRLSSPLFPALTQARDFPGLAHPPLGVQEMNNNSIVYSGHYVDGCYEYR